MHVYMNLPPKSLIGREVYRLIYYVMEKNIYNRNSNNRTVELTYETFLKVLNSRTCLRDEIRRNLCGIDISIKDMVERGILKVRADGEDSDEPEEYPPSKSRQAQLLTIKVKNSCCNELDDQTIAEMNEAEKDTVNHELAHFIFQNVEVPTDVSYGQRGFCKN